MKVKLVKNLEEIAGGIVKYQEGQKGPDNLLLAQHDIEMIIACTLLQSKVTP